MKIIKLLKKISIFLLLLNFLFHEVIITCERIKISSSFKSNYKLTKNKDAAESENKTPTGTPPQSTYEPEETASSLIKKAGEDLPDVPIYYQGWVKYFRYFANSEEKPKTFFKNTFYAKQQPGNDKDEKDNYGSKKIPSEKHFFLIIYKDTANILTSRENPLLQLADSMMIDFVKTIPEDNNYMGGIKDFGKFSEGSCFEVSTVKPGAFFQMTSQDTEPQTGLREVWLICSEDDVQKKKIMDILIKLKLRKQHSVGVYVSTTNDPLLKKKSLSPNDNKQTVSDILGANPNFKDPNAINPADKKAEDGYWIILQDWTPCTLKCGGGLQYLQLMCSPPRKGGKPCQGEAIRTRPCNPQPCPKIEVIKGLLPKTDDKNGTTSKIEKPIIKIMPISSRPQRYDKCYIKETDALMVKNDISTASFDILPKIPIRLVMNNKTVSVYQDETLQTNLSTFLLSTTTISRVNGDNRCFILNGINSKAQFCQLDSQSGNFVEEWDYDFNLFKFQCKQKRETIKLANQEEQKLAKDYKDKLNQLKQDMVEKKAEQVKKQVETKEEVKLQKKIEQTQSMTLMAIQKELKLEEMLEREEAQREREEQQALQVQLESEKKKNECLTKSIREKELEDQMNISKSNAEEAIQKIKQDAMKQIMVKRSQIKQKIENMRKKNKRRLTQMQNDIINLRTETAGKVQKYARVGDIKNCFNPTSMQAAALPKIEEYCQMNFPDNYSKFMECKNADTFCFVCCENEFGELHIADREKCYKGVCESSDSAAISSVVAVSP